MTKITYWVEAPSEEEDADDELRCECGEWSGEACTWSGPAASTVVVEYMPDHLRASHEAAGNAGSYPANGSARIRVSGDCAANILEHDGDWASVIGERTA